MRRELLNRVRALEQAIQVDAWLTLTFPDGEQQKLLGRATHFFRLRDLLLDPDAFEATHPRGVLKMAEQDLEALRRAVHIEGDSAQMFSLLQALALGPMEGVAV